MKSEILRRAWAVLAGAVIFAATGSARAQDASTCVNDVDCPDPACGGQVCDYNKGPSCQPAGVAKKGMDGWCTADSDCKCQALGAKCIGMLYCSFTLPSQAPAGGTGGAAGTGGSTGAGGSTTGSGGTTAAPPASSDSGGCALATRPASGLASAGLLVGLGAAAYVARRRRRSA